MSLVSNVSFHTGIYAAEHFTCKDNPEDAESRIRWHRCRQFDFQWLPHPKHGFRFYSLTAVFRFYCSDRRCYGLQYRIPTIPSRRSRQCHNALTGLEFPQFLSDSSRHSKSGTPYHVSDRHFVFFLLQANNRYLTRFALLHAPFTFGYSVLTEKSGYFLRFSITTIIRLKPAFSFVEI